MGVKQRASDRVIRWWGQHGGVAQFHHPTGFGGHVAGWVMGRRSSNVARNRWAVELLDIRPEDRVIELGCGPGVAIAALAARADHGVVVGVDHSQAMITQARRRNRAAVAAGRVQLIHASVEQLPVLGEQFDAALAVNTVGMWPEPAKRLSELGDMLRPGGRIAVVSQPRCVGATAATTASAARETAALLAGAGFEQLRVETLELDPPVACVLGTRAGGRDVRRQPAP